MEITQHEQSQLQSLMGHFPFRTWFLVRPTNGEASFFCDSMGKAKKAAKETSGQIFKISKAA